MLGLKNGSGDSMAVQYINFIMYCFKERKMPNGDELTNRHEEYLLKSLEIAGEIFSEERIYRDALNEIEQMIQTAVIPYLTSDSDILRVRSAAVIESFGPITYRNNETYQAICAGLCSCMSHEKIAV
jgi:hypothetical protein